MQLAFVTFRSKQNTELTEKRKHDKPHAKASSLRSTFHCGPWLESKTLPVCFHIRLKATPFTKLLTILVDVLDFPSLKHGVFAGVVDAIAELFADSECELLEEGVLIWSANVTV